MTTFIKLTLYDYSHIWVNPAHITTLAGSHRAQMTAVCMIDGDPDESRIEVKETPDEIMEMIEDLDA